MFAASVANAHAHTHARTHEHVERHTNTVSERGTRTHRDRHAQFLLLPLALHFYSSAVAAASVVVVLLLLLRFADFTLVLLLSHTFCPHFAQIYCN